MTWACRNDVMLDMSSTILYLNAMVVKSRPSDGLYLIINGSGFVGRRLYGVPSGRALDFNSSVLSLLLHVEVREMS